MYISLQDMFKIGIGPSSSHTVGPMRAARRFLLELPDGLLAQAARVQVELFGSLAHTGVGHGTDRAVLMGLCGEIPDDVDTGSIASRIQAIEQEQAIILMGTQKVHFERERDLVFNFVDELRIEQELETTPSGRQFPTQTQVTIDTDEPAPRAPGALIRFFAQARNLTEQQIADLAAYFSSRESQLRDLHGVH